MTRLVHCDSYFSFHLFIYLFFFFLEKVSMIYLHVSISLNFSRIIIRIFNLFYVVPFALYIQKKNFVSFSISYSPSRFIPREISPTTLAFYDFILSLRRKYVDTPFHDYNNIELPGLIIIPIPHKCSITFLHEKCFFFAQKLLDKLATFPAS